ncbi:MAG: cell division protein FtsQ/DivIB [Rubrobacteraceae bacterium]|jgi:cell division protein FtsQ|nr:FtsQ-type POTRA domain-containing protein [Rubrobacter sp.]
MKPSAAMRILRAVSFSLVVAGMTVACVFVAAYLLFPLEGIEVSGERMYPESEAESLASDYSSLLTLNTRMVEEEVEAHPWVEAARVRKMWDLSIVSVEVEERRPVLHAEIEGRRAVFSGDGTELPGLGGADLRMVELDIGKAPEILDAVRTFEENGVRFGSVDGVGPGGVEATVEGRPVVFYGGVEVGQVRALPDVMEENPEAPVFDLRSPDRVVAGAVGGGDVEPEG